MWYDVYLHWKQKKVLSHYSFVGKAENIIGIWSGINVIQRTDSSLNHQKAIGKQTWARMLSGFRFIITYGESRDSWHWPNSKSEFVHFEEKSQRSLWNPTFGRAESSARTVRLLSLFHILNIMWTLLQGRTLIFVPQVFQFDGEHPYSPQCFINYQSVNIDMNC